MTNAAIGLVVLVAIAPALVALPGRDHPSRRDGVVCAVLCVLAATTAILAALGSDPTGLGRVAGAIGAAVAAITGGGSVVRTILRAGGVVGPNGDGANGDDPNGDGPNDAPPGTENQGDRPHQPGPVDRGPLRGGRVIGYLERAAVVVTLLLGWPEGLAIILAVKSLARYPELRAPHASEQFIMGTFASVLWAASMAGVGYLLMN